MATGTQTVLWRSEVLPLMPSTGWDLPGGEQGGQQEAAGCAEPLLGKCWPPRQGLKLRRCFPN